MSLTNKNKVINRDVKTDVIRGFAIILMFFAHSAPYVENDYLNSNTLFRIICSLSAPLFLFLVGFNLKKGLTLPFLKKGLFILVCAALIDLFVWDIVPFYSFDVLYLIGFSVVLFPLWSKINTTFLTGFIILILITAFVYQGIGFYDYNLKEPTLSQLNDFSVLTLTKNLFFDGWFPIFPWISIVIFGYLVKNEAYRFNKLIYIGVCSFLIGLFLIYLNQTSFLREFAVEVFYPFNHSYLLLSFGWIVIIFSLQLNYSSKIFIPLIKLGKTSLFLYAFHLSIYHVLFKQVLDLIDDFYISTLFFTLIYIGLAYLIDYIKYKYKIKHPLFNSIFGK